MALIVSFILLLCTYGIAGVQGGQCGSGQLFCAGINQCYTKDKYNCLKGFLCPTNCCLCGANTCYTSQYGCERSSIFQLAAPNGHKDKDGTCPSATSKGDPLMRGFDGCLWYLRGTPGKVYNLVAGAEDTVNTLLIPANFTDSDHKESGTFHGALSFRHRGNTVEATVTAEGNLTVSVDGQVQEPDSRFQAGELKGKVVRHMPFFGQYAEIITPSFTYGVHAVQPAVSEAGFERGHADVDITLRNTVPDLNGLLGQSALRMQQRNCADSLQFPGEGTEEDYVVADLLSVLAIPTADVPAARARILSETDDEAAFPVTATTSA